MKDKKILSCLAISILILSSIFFYKVYKLDRNINNSSEIKNEEEEINKDELHEDLKKSNNEENNIVNILLLGIDKQENASDTMMILSINKEKKTIKLVSIMRDIFVYQGEGMANKMNYAYHYGGVENLCNTINNVFGLDISKFVMVDFDSFVDIVDYIDGIDMNIDEREKENINLMSREYVLESAGNVRLNGQQALAYSRIRQIDSDFERTERQRKVMHAIFIRLKTIAPYKYLEVLYNLMKISKTNLSAVDILEYGDIAYACGEKNISEFRVPIDGTSNDSTEGVYHLEWDEEVNRKALNDFLNS